jgi:hypothetical protein
MNAVIFAAIDICDKSENKHIKCFGKLLMNHLDGITNFGKCRITSRKVEGTVRKIKFIRALGFGYSDYYFFLKIIDGTRWSPQKILRPKILLPHLCTMKVVLQVILRRRISRSLI